MDEKPKIFIEKNTDLYPQCNFCLTENNVNTLYTDRLSIAVSICDECLSKICKDKSEKEKVVNTEVSGEQQC